MKYIKIIVTLLGVLFAFLSLSDLLHDDISMPLMMVFLGMSEFILAKECFETNRKTMGFLTLGAGIFIYIITIYIVCF